MLFIRRVTMDRFGGAGVVEVYKEGEGTGDANVEGGDGEEAGCKEG